MIKIIKLIVDMKYNKWYNSKCREEVITINKYEITEISNRRYIIQTYTKEFGLAYVLEKNTLNPKVFTKTEVIEYITKWL